MKEKNIRILKIEPGKKPYEKEIENSLKAVQQEVGGLIEVIPIGEDNLAVCNEEGKINGMKPNRWLGDDIICGSFFICSDTPDGDFGSITQKGLDVCQKHFEEIPTFSGEEQALEPRIDIIGFGY